MTVVYIICFILLCIGTFFVLDLTPESIGEDVSALLHKRESLRDRALAARGQRKKSKVLLFLEKTQRALADAGREKQFGVACAAALLLMIAGSILALAIGNPFLAPVFAIAFAFIPFLYLMRTVEQYDAQVRLELESGLGTITTSYERTKNLQVAVRESLDNLKPPVRGLFESFLAEIDVITPDVTAAIYHLKEKVHDVVFEEWCDGLINCQRDNQLVNTLSPIVAKYLDMRIVNNELKVMISENRREYVIMALMVIANIPMLYFLNQDWYAALMYTTFGKVTLAVCGVVMLFTAIKLMQYTKPVEYKK